jgi:hypothetical protein
MPLVTTADVDAAARFLAGNARVLDRRRFERLFSGGDARPVRDAVAAFRNSDGGFGHALEPDGRTPASQPAAVAIALATLDETDAWDEELVAGACEWLAANAADASFVEPTVEGWPHAPWWEAEEGRPASLFTTGQIAATLHRAALERKRGARRGPRPGRNAASGHRRPSCPARIVREESQAIGDRRREADPETAEGSG